jgi:hypothetical protein
MEREMVIEKENQKEKEKAELSAIRYSFTQVPFNDPASAIRATNYPLPTYLSPDPPLPSRPP